MYRRCQNHSRQPDRDVEEEDGAPSDRGTRTPPTTGPSAMETPTTAPQIPTAWARSRGLVKVLVMIDIATGFSIDPPTAWTMRKTMRVSRSGATLQSSEPAANVVSPMTKVRRAPEAVGRRTGDHQEAGQHEGVGVDRPLEARERGVEVVPDGGQRDVHDGDVDPDDQEAHGADRRMPMRRRRLSASESAALGTVVSTTIIVIITSVNRSASPLESQLSLVQQLGEVHYSAQQIGD